MDYYKPSLRLSFVYLIATDKVYLRPTVTVWMPAGETLIGHTPAYQDASRSGEQIFDHMEYRAKLEPYLYEHETLIEILSSVNAPYTPNDKPGFIAALRQELASSYTFKAVVNEIPNIADTGGQTSSMTGSSAGEVVIH